METLDLKDLEKKLAEAGDRSRRKTQIILKALSEVRSETCSSAVASSAVNAIRMELVSLNSEDLVSLAENCVGTVRNDSDRHFSWKDVLSECLMLLKERSSPINLSGTDVSGAEYVSRCLQSLCAFEWAPSVAVPLAEMFRDIPVNREEHHQITKKLCHSLGKLPSDSIPSLLHQLLRLCEERNASLVFYAVTDHFTERLYPKSKDAFLDSESPAMGFDDIEICESDDDLWKAHATCLYVVSDSGGIPRSFLNALKLGSRRPGSVLSKPPLIHFLLIADGNRELCSELIRSTISFNSAEKKKRNQFSWCSGALPEPVDVDLLLKRLVDDSLNRCQTIRRGLLSLSSLLLSAGNDDLNSHGRLLLTALARNVPEVMKLSLRLLKDKLCEDMSRASLIAGSLDYLCRYCPQSVIDNMIVVQSILEDCFSIFERDSNWLGRCEVLNSLRPIIGVDARLRDSLIMLCRKGLFSREPVIGRTAIFGFLLLLKILRTTSGESLSQDFTSNTLSVLTQITIDVHSSDSLGKKSNVNNNAICMEIIFQLRKCFKQTWEVKEQLYKDLSGVIRQKPEILNLITELFYEHLTSKYCSLDEERLPPINLENCVSLRDDGAILEEPLGMFLYCIQQLLADSAEEINEPLVEHHSGHSLKLFDLLLQLATNMGKCTPTHFKLDDGIHLNDILPESRAYCIQVQQALQCCEALIAFVVNNWTIIPVDRVRLIIDLHKTYLELIDFTKTNTKTKKGVKKNKNNKSILTSQDENTQKSTEKTKKEKLKFSDLTKVQFKMPVTVWDLSLCFKILQLLHTDKLTWVSNEEILQIQTKRDFHRTTIKLTCQATKNALSSMPSKNTFESINDCAKLLYERCIHRLDDFCDFDIETALLVIECFQEMFSLVMEKYSRHLNEFLESLVEEKNELDDIPKRLDHVLETISTQLLKSVEGQSNTDEPSAKKLPSQLFNLFVNMMEHLPVNSAHCDKWRQWLVHLSTLKASNWVGASLVAPLLQLSARSRDPWGSIEALIKALSKIMGTISDDSTDDANDEESYPFFYLTSNMAPSALLHLCSHLNARISALELMAGRLKAEHSVLQYKIGPDLTTALSALKNRELVSCQEMIDVSNCCRGISELMCPPGNCSTAVLKLLTRLHNLLAVFAAHFAVRDTALLNARFDRVVRVSGKPLYQAVDAFIIHVEGARDNERNVNKGKVLQDTKQIPLLVCAREQLCKKVLILSKKTKIDLSSHIPAGSARDFRIKASTVKEVLESHGEAANMNITESVEDEENAADMLEVEMNECSDEEKSDESVHTADEENVPPRKKSRKA